MPSLEHQALIEMFRENPALAPHLLSLVFHLEVPQHASVRVADATLDQLIPVEFRADLVLDLRDAAGDIVLAVVLEAQRACAGRKKYTWPVYAAVARAERECPTVVLVVAPEPEVAAWATEKIEIGLGLGSLSPLVLGPATVPLVTEPSVAEQEVELAVLSAMAHGNGPSGVAVVAAALAGLARLDSEHATVYFQVVYNGLREPMRRAMEAMAMERLALGKVKFPPLMQSVIDREVNERVAQEVEERIAQEVEERIAQEVEERIAQEVEESALGVKRDVLIRLAARCGLTLGDEDRARIQACTDGATLDRWLDDAVGARSAAEMLG